MSHALLVICGWPSKEVNGAPDDATFVPLVSWRSLPVRSCVPVRLEQTTRACDRSKADAQRTDAERKAVAAGLYAS